MFINYGLNFEEIVIISDAFEFTLHNLNCDARATPSQT
jgi:hypothetical protein